MLADIGHDRHNNLGDEIVVGSVIRTEISPNIGRVLSLHYSYLLLEFLSRL
jgi:hypothetical protein